MLRYVVLVVLVCASVPLRAQYGPVQDSTLIGLRRVALNVTTDVKDANTFREDIALELRKAGIRVAPDSTRPDSVDGVLNVLVRSRGSCQKLIRIDVEQRARLVRTGNTHRMVTWFYEDDANGTACRDSWYPSAIKRAVDAFLTKWLDVNGR
jgi:hypothetical protein